MKLCSKILIVLAVMKIIACRPPQKKEIEAKVQQNTSSSGDNLDSSGLKEISEEPTAIERQDTAIIDPHGRQPLGSSNQDLTWPIIGERPKETGANQITPPKYSLGESMIRFRRHRRSTGSWRRGNLVKRGSQVFALARRCNTASAAPQDHLSLQQENVEFRFGNQAKFVPAGCKTMTSTLTRVCRVYEMPVTIQQDPPVEVFKRFCENFDYENPDSGLLNSGNGLRGGGEHICEQEYLYVTLADQQQIRVQSGCSFKFL